MARYGYICSGLKQVKIRFDRNSQAILLEVTKGRDVKKMEAKVRQLMKAAKHLDLRMVLDGNTLELYDETEKIKLCAIGNA